MSIPATLSEQVSDAKGWDISYRTLHPTAIICDEQSGRNIQIPFSSLTNKYKDFLSSIVVTRALSDEEISQYRFKPKTLSEGLYGTTEFWNDILILNNCFSVTEFQPTSINVYDPDKLKAYINEILILEDIITE